MTTETNKQSAWEELIAIKPAQDMGKGYIFRRGYDAGLKAKGGVDKVKLIELLYSDRYGSVADLIMLIESGDFDLNKGGE